jgi:molybdate transport system substrate-binding protein
MSSSTTGSNFLKCAVRTLVALGVFVNATHTAAAPQTATVLVAASVKDAVAEAAKNFEAEDAAGVKVKVSAGASNALAAQVLADAPADLFLSASQEWADKVKEKGYAARTVPLLSNELVLVVPKGNPAKIATPADLAGAGVRRLALAGENVPAGKYAEQALRSLKLYDDLAKSRKIARGADVRATLAYVERGEAEAGIVYATDAKISDKVEAVHVFEPKTFDPIVYSLVLLKSGERNPAAVRFFDYLASDKAQAVFTKHGFVTVKAER